MDIYGNDTLPGFVAGKERRLAGSIFRGPVEKDFFKVVTIIGGAEGEPLKAGTIVKKNIDSYAPLAVTDISPSFFARIGIVVDKTAAFGTADEPNTALVGFRGEADQSQLFIGDTTFNDLTDVNKDILLSKFAAWGIDLIPVEQA